MQSIGKFLKILRRSRKLSLQDLEQETKIKSKYLSAIEAERWSALPDYPVVVGFVKNIASALGADRQKAVALLRRDYPPQKSAVNPKPDVGKEFRWGPRLTFALMALSAFLLVSSYLVFQYIRFQKPPELEVKTPQEGQLITDSILSVEGNTASSVSVTVNGQPTKIDEEGNFSIELEVDDSVDKIKVVATSRSEKETVVQRNIKVKLE